MTVSFTFATAFIQTPEVEQPAVSPVSDGIPAEVTILRSVGERLEPCVTPSVTEKA